MSSPDASRYIVLSPRAEQDFIDILGYTGKTWVIAQLEVYHNKIDDALRLLAQNPGLGHRSPNLPETHRLYHVGSHVIIYRDQETILAIVRILHQRMSLSRHV